MRALDRLAGCAGRWQGSNRLHDPHTGRPEDSASTAVLASLLGGTFLRLDYTWSYQGTAQEGSLLIGFQSEPGRATVHWIDSWHMADGVLACEGAVEADGTVAVRGSYAVPPGPDWGRLATLARGRLTAVNTDTKWIVGTGVAVIASVVGSAVAVIAVFVTLVGGVGEEVRSVREEVRSVREEVRSVRGEVGSVREEVGSVRVEMQRLRTELNTRMDGFDTRLRNVEIAFGKVDQRLLTLERILLPPREPAE